MRRRTTRNAVIISVLTVIFCVSLLGGVSYAWFTNSVTSTGNRIVAGSLSIDLLMDKNADGNYTSIASENGDIFSSGDISLPASEKAWLPSKTRIAYLAIANNGDLDLKYQVALMVQNNANDLYQAMLFKIVPDASSEDSLGDWAGISETARSVTVGTQIVSGDPANTAGHDVILEKGLTHYFALVMHMDDDAGIEYQNGEVAFDLKVIATQVTAESGDITD